MVLSKTLFKHSPGQYKSDCIHLPDTYWPATVSDSETRRNQRNAGHRPYCKGSILLHHCLISVQSNNLNFEVLKEIALYNNDKEPTMFNNPDASIKNKNNCGVLPKRSASFTGGMTLRCYRVEQNIDGIGL